jgi:hypothetical protein
MIQRCGKQDGGVGLSMVVIYCDVSIVFWMLSAKKEQIQKFKNSSLPSSPYGGRHVGFGLIP